MANRYARQMVLREIGPEGQMRLQSARVLCVGVGGLGSPAALYLAAAGVGTLGLIDPDTVDVSNLQRQILFTSSDEGQSKVIAGARRLKDLNPDCIIKTYQEALTPQNAEALFSDYDIILDGTDNFSAKFLINDAAAKLSKPVVYGSISQFTGHVSVFWAKHGPCYRCLFPNPPKNYVPNCAEAGVIGGVAGVIGTLQAVEAVKLIVGGPTSSDFESLIGKYLMLDLATMTFSTLDLAKRADCKICSMSADSISLPADECSTGVCACAETKNIDWQIDANDLQSALDEFLIVDVREQHEYENAHIPGAILAPLSDLEDGELGALGNHYGKKDIVIYCHAGVRSLRALEILREAGFNLAKHLKGGLCSWRGDLTSK